MADNEFLTYKGKPLVRKGDTLYYGDMSERYVVMLQIKGTKKVGDLSVANDIAVTLMSTDPDAPPQEKILKKGERHGLYDAVDMAVVWLDKALAGK